MRQPFTISSIKQSACASKNQHLFEGQVKKKRSKYGAVKTVVDNIKFDSTKEAGRYLKLKMLERAGLIKNLQLQVPYELNEGGTHSIKYVADFVYQDVRTGETIVEDAKGYRTKVYLKKRRLMQEVHNIIIKEV